MTIIHHPQRQTIIFGGIILTLILNLFLGLFFTPILRQTKLTSVSIFFFSRLYCWLSLILIYLYSSKVEKRNFLIWPEKKYSLIYYLKSIILTVLVLFATQLLIFFIIKPYIVNFRNARSEEILRILIGNKFLVLFTALTAGITEELIFRGYFMTRLNLLFKNIYIPILLSSLFFGVAHIGYESIMKIIIIFITGLILAIHYQKYKNIKMLIMLHFLWDLSIMAFYTF